MKKRILNKVSSVFNVSPEEIVNISRKRGCVDARLAYFLSMYALGIDIHKVNKGLPFTHTMPSFYVSKGLSLFTLYRDYRTKVKNVISAFDEYVCEQFAKENPLSYENKKDLSFLYEPVKKRKKIYFSNVKSVAIANYTKEENMRIDIACAEAEKFFENYGKGLGRMPIVDRKKYAN